MRSIHHTILEQIRKGSITVLATVVRASGSTPQKPGSAALFGEERLLAGTVGGGLLEGEVQHIAKNVMISGFSDQFYFNLDSDQEEEGAICGGEAEVLIDAHPEAHLKAMEAMEESLSARKQGFMLTMVNKKHEQGRIIQRYWLTISARQDLPAGLNLPSSLDPAVKESITAQIKDTIRYGFKEIEFQHSHQGQVEMAYLEHIQAMPHLVIAGAGHVGKALAHMGALLEFEVTVIDDRAEFANPDNIPDADHFVVREIGPAMEELEAGSDTFIVIVTRGHTHDAEALKPCIGANAAYIGMIGSTHKVGLMKKKFMEEKWATPEQWESIYTPIGLAIGSKTVEEIAISIAAQLVEVRSRKKEPHAE